MKNSRAIIIAITTAFVTILSGPLSDVLLLSGLVPPNAAQAAPISPTTERVNLTSGGAQVTAISQFASISGDGRFVAFLSNATNLVLTDNNGSTDVFVRDRATGVTERVSVNPGGGEGNGNSGTILVFPAGGSFFDGKPSISADGRFVAFESDASNLVAGDTNARSDIFVRDRLNGTTERVSVATGGAQGNGISHHPAISADGLFVAFESTASNLVPDDTNAVSDVFVRDRVRGTTTLVVFSTGGGRGNGFSSDPAISADGRYVAFDSGANNLVPGGINGNDIYLRDRFAGTTERVNTGTGNCFFPSISADGRYVAFERNSGTDQGVFLRDRINNSTERVDVAVGGGQPNPNGGGGRPVISADGRYVAFGSGAVNLITGDNNSSFDVFLRDRVLATTERVSVPKNGEGNSSSFGPAISADGRFVAFVSGATNMVAGDTNTLLDIFVRDRAAIPAVQLSVGDAQASEGNGFNIFRSLAFTVNLSARSREDVSFRFWTEDLSARAGADYTRQTGEATVPAGATSVIVTAPILGDLDPEANETMHLNIDLPLNASIADGQGVGTIVNDDVSFTVGTLDLTPPNATIAVGDRLTYRLSWTVPSTSWRDLDTIELRIGQDGSILWLRFGESSGTLSLYDPATGDFGPSFPAGRPAVLTSRAATLYLDESSVTAAGPASPEVTLELSLAFKPQASVGEYPIEVRATNDLGEIQGFERAATLTIVPRLP